MRASLALKALAVSVPLLASGPSMAQSQEQVPSEALQAQSPPPSQTRQLSLWELGVGLGAVGYRDYRGSDTTHAYPVPFGYFVYRGRFLKADRNGARARLLNKIRVELSVSLDATTPVRNNAARQGMPELRPTVEIGPALYVHVWRSESERVKLDVRLPVRVASTLGSPGYIGWFFAPNVNLDVVSPLGFAGWNLGLLTGPLFATRRYDDYYYSVAPQYATPLRPA
jgi:MipA family protein